MARAELLSPQPQTRAAEPEPLSEQASAEFLAPRMHFILPPSQLQPPALDLAGNILSTSSMLGNGGNILSTGGGVLDTMDTGGALETGEDFLATGCWQEA